MVLYDRIIALCESRGIKGGKMCTDIGISKGILTDLKYGRAKGLSAITAQKIASYFNVTVGYLLGEEDLHKGEEDKPHVKVAEKLLEMLKDEDFVEMFDDFHKLDAKKRRIVINLVHSLIEV